MKDFVTTEPTTIYMVQRLRTSRLKPEYFLGSQTYLTAEEAQAEIDRRPKTSGGHIAYSVVAYKKVS